MKFTNTYKRKDGTIVKLVAEDFRNPLNTGDDIEYYALVYKPHSKKPILIQGGHDGDKSLKGLPLEEYKKSNHRGILSVVSYAELIQTGLQLKGMVITCHIG